MQIDINELIELVKSVKPMFLNHTEAGHVTVKGRADFVTQVDIRVQDYMRTELSKRWPKIQFMGEEKDNSDIDFNGAVWILDPVDGTTNLIHDFKDSALSLGLCEQGEATLGIIYQPFLDEIFWAQKGKGAFCNGKRIHVSDTQKLEESLVSVGTSPYHRDLTEDNFAAFRCIYDRCVDIRRMGAASVDLAYVACGRVEAYFERNLKPWDFAAGKVIVEEAGGRVIDMEGKRANVMEPSDIIAGNSCIEEEIKKLLIGLKIQ